MFGKNVVVTGAICKCSFGKIPDVLSLLLNTSIHANDAIGPPKFIASTADIFRPFLLNSFGPCTKLYNLPCTVMVTHWQDYSDSITVNGHNCLLENSTATCAFGAPGCISIVHHGQIQGVSNSQFENADAEINRMLNPAVQLKAVSDDSRIPEGITIF